MRLVSRVSVFLLLLEVVGCGKGAKNSPVARPAQQGDLLQTQAVPPPSDARTNLVGRWVVTGDGETRPLAFLEFTPLGQSVAANLVSPEDPLGRKFPIVYSLKGKTLSISCYGGSDEMGGNLELAADGTYRGSFGLKGEEHPATMMRQ